MLLLEMLLLEMLMPSNDSQQFQKFLNRIDFAANAVVGCRLES